MIAFDANPGDVRHSLHGDTQGLRGIDLRVLGPFEMSIDGTATTLRGERAIKVFALLVLNANMLVPIQRIVDFTWAEPPNSARQQIHNVVSALRRTLTAADGRADIVTMPSGYKLEVAEQAIDLFRFQADLRTAESAEAAQDVRAAIDVLNLAVGRWRGPALANVDSHLAASIAASLNDQYLGTFERLAKLSIAVGESTSVIGGLTRLVGEHPYREQLRALLMIALHGSGRQSEALSVFEQGRQLLSRELGLDPGPILRAAHEQVLSGGQVIRGTDDKPPPPNLPSVLPPTVRPFLDDEQHPVDGPTFLPRDIGEFTGRLQEIDYLTSGALREVPNVPTVLVVYGMGGVGKTTLVIRMAHRMSEHYPDGRYFIDLEGFSARDEPVKPLQALSLLLRQSGAPPELLPPDLNGCVALWRSRLAGKRALILLDNAADVEQVRTLLPSAPGVLVLISSRRRMTELEGIEPLCLDVMSPTEALSLLSTIVGPDRVGAEPEAAQAIAELCGRLPLAIHIVAARLRTRINWSISSTAQQLRSQRGRARLLAIGERSVVDVLSWSYRHLTGEQQRFFRLLSLHPGPQVDAYAAAALAAVSRDDAEACLDELFEANLVEQRTSDFYQLHDLVRDCSWLLLNEHTDEASRRRAVAGLADYYLQSARSWCTSVTKGFFTIGSDVVADACDIKEPADDETAFELYELEYRNLCAVQRLAVEYGLHELAWQLTCYLLPYLALLNYAGEARAMLESALASARAAESRRGESICLTGVASIHRRQGRYGEAATLLKQALKLSRGLDDNDAQIRQLTLMGLVYAEEDRLDEARAAYSAAEALANEMGDVQAQATLVNNLGNISLESGRFNEALDQFRRGYDLDDGFGMYDLRMTVLVNMGYCFLLTGRSSEAEAHFGESLALSRKAKNKLNEINALVGLCSAARTCRAFADSLKFGREALELAQGLKKDDLVLSALGALGDAHLSIGNVKESWQVFSQALMLAANSDSARYTAMAYEGLAHVSSACHDTDAAGEHWRRALELGGGGVYHRSEAQAHLASPIFGTALCWRCRTTESVEP